ncbi:hypothetical protein Pmani_024644 [Petrolisthes manimaculis]|uniref:Uncharacterized protein n=1 Tax=Petrolisthes manimaculis TaxID=1843537 RepID=A0AAE1P9B5_9EUCA|nr:hypothetical protein Pmani_024644 [Petrolisthes manimaculis]
MEWKRLKIEQAGIERKSNVDEEKGKTIWSNFTSRLDDDIDSLSALKLEPVIYAVIRPSLAGGEPDDVAVVKRGQHETQTELNCPGEMGSLRE